MDTILDKEITCSFPDFPFMLLSLSFPIYAAVVSEEFGVIKCSACQLKRAALSANGVACQERHRYKAWKKSHSAQSKEEEKGSPTTQAASARHLTVLKESNATVVESQSNSWWFWQRKAVKWNLKRIMGSDACWMMAFIVVFICTERSRAINKETKRKKKE